VRKRLRHLPSGLLASAVLVLVGVPVGWLTRGGADAAGVAAGVALVAASYTIGSVVIAWADSINPRLIMPIGLLTYVVKFALIGVVMALVAASGWAGLYAMGVSIIVAAVGWMVAQAWWTWRARILYVEIDGG
jgi:ATP synthase protein I